MTTSAASADADTRRVIDERCRVYQQHFGFNAYRDPTLGTIRAAADRVSGVMMTRTLGIAVSTVLRGQPVPIFSVGHQVWVFLTQRPAHADAAVRLSIDLAVTHGVVPIRPDAPIALPTPGDEKRAWLRIPEGRTLPPFATVVDAVRTAVTPAGRR
jgi:hypothetical protein